jgi:hypothetical protein
VRPHGGTRHAPRTPQPAHPPPAHGLLACLGARSGAGRAVFPIACSETFKTPGGGSDLLACCLLHSAVAKAEAAKHAKPTSPFAAFVKANYKRLAATVIWGA